MTTLPGDAPLTASDPWQLLEGARAVLAVHAHPDDESLSTGFLLAHLVRSGTRVELVTATRGEAGEVVAGALDPADPRPLEEVRAAEIDRAVAALGLAARYDLGTDPALAAGAAARRYRDSGMRWIREGLAGPALDASPESFTARPRQEAVDDLAALIETVRPDLVLGYDDAGTYGHPDHVRAHEISVAACAATAVPYLEVASAGAEEQAFVWRELPQVQSIVLDAVRSYRTQLTVLGPREDGIAIRHVGGQEDLVSPRTGLRVLRG